ncbi:hypothetical protein A3709_19900 [Halioglobus sp. HI00S01]|uniref:hypothetical protein n=1 Tax=Halioglobus sp. HI00S01 TaxID=1822214 RepID=UPI0007C2BD7C|nr:hypothetical protein [Halioglobus sp. HI00S01]KZX57889.1 hypothetical protein A3709_19900 [Halioglobus sp. HI00S01]
MRTIWLVIFNPLPGNSVGGYDWFYDREDALRSYDSIFGSSEARFKSVVLPDTYDGAPTAELTDRISLRIDEEVYERGLGDFFGVDIWVPGIKRRIRAVWRIVQQYTSPQFRHDTV